MIKKNQETRFFGRFKKIILFFLHGIGVKEKFL